MPFKIVQTLEDGEQCLCIVPSAWEHDGTLWWPKKTTAAKLMRDENSKPTSKWQRMQCTRKREYRTLLEAEVELQRMEAISDRMIGNVPLVESSQEEEGVATVALQLADGTLQNVVYLNDNSEAGTSDAELVIHSVVTDTPQPITLDEIAANQAVIIENQTKIITCVAQLKTGMDYLNVKVDALEAGSSSGASAVLSDGFFEPIDSVEMFDALESSLKDDAVMSMYARNMSYICGTTGREDGVDCCYILIDHFATRAFLTKCSWTGISRDNAVDGPSGESEPQSKIPFMNYKRVRQLFLKLIMQADTTFSSIKCEAFLKRVLKNSKQRVLSSTVSKHKNRPTNLQYAARNQKLPPA
ncbi:hypothetical protein RP20_CCG000151 [Aedes albopictus]|nr:hypothetical protein RP20_CCG000151 [Aedes albopictus]